MGIKKRPASWRTLSILFYLNGLFAFLFFLNTFRLRTVFRDPSLLTDIPGTVSEVPHCSIGIRISDVSLYRSPFTPMITEPS